MVPDNLIPDRAGWEPSPTSVNFSRFTREGAPDLWAIIMDTSTTRVVTFWTREEMERLFRRGLDVIGALPDGLVLATPEDLGNLKPPGE